MAKTLRYRFYLNDKYSAVPAPINLVFSTGRRIEYRKKRRSSTAELQDNSIAVSYQRIV